AADVGRAGGAARRRRASAVHPAHRAGARGETAVGAHSGTPGPGARVRVHVDHRRCECPRRRRHRGRGPVIGHVLADTATMFQRSARKTLRSRDTLIISLLMPILIMLLFTYVFGGAINVGGPYLDYVVPGIML